MWYDKLTLNCAFGRPLCACTVNGRVVGTGMALKKGIARDNAAIAAFELFAREDSL